MKFKEVLNKDGESKEDIAFRKSLKVGDRVSFLDDNMYNYTGIILKIKGGMISKKIVVIDVDSSHINDAKIPMYRVWPLDQFED